MSDYISGPALRALRERRGLTQKALGEARGRSDSAGSKRGTGGGRPGGALREGRAAARGVSVAELLAGEQVVNRNRSGNLKKLNFYVCPVCGNVLTALGQASISCCGVTLPPLETEEEGHPISVECIDHEYWVTLDHPMTKEHYVSVLALVTTERLELVKLYPEQECAHRFSMRGHGLIYAFCNRHGLSVRRV